MKTTSTPTHPCRGTESEGRQQSQRRHDRKTRPPPRKYNCIAGFEEIV